MKNSTHTTDLKGMTVDELRREIAGARNEYTKIGLHVEMQKEKNHASYKTKRREIARMMTVLNQLMKGEKSTAGVTKVVKPAKIITKKPSQVTKKSVKGVRSKSKKS